MELAVGEIFAQEGSYYQVCLDTKITCAGCVFDGHGKCARNKDIAGEYAASKRKDGNSVIFQKVVRNVQTYILNRKLLLLWQ